MAKESSLKNMVITLLLITFISGAAVGGVYSLTKDSIAATKLAKVNNSIAEVVPEFDNNPSEEQFTQEDLIFYPAKKGDELVGMAVSSYTNNGFSGRFDIMIGFRPDGTIHNIVTLEQSETPGLGAKIADKQKEGGKPVFTTQFIDKNPASYRLVVTKDGGDVDAITASTITSRAFTEAVQKAYDGFMKLQNEQNKK